MNDALFDTPIGRCALAWTGARLAFVQLPEASDALTIAQLRARAGSSSAEQPRWILDVGVALARAMTGAPIELPSGIYSVDQLTPFVRAVSVAAQRIPPGETRTYGELAREVGRPGAARAVGQAMARNPWPILIPCHRVVGAGGAIGGFSAGGGVRTKERLLALERGGLAAITPSTRVSTGAP